MKIPLVKTLNGSLKPANDYGYEQLKKIKAGAEVECEIRMPRNYRFHKKFFALVKTVFDNQERYNNMEHLRKDLIIASGFYEVRYNLDGVEIYEAESISFASMDEAKFSELYNAVVNTICTHFHFDKEELIAEVAENF